MTQKEIKFKKFIPVEISGKIFSAISISSTQNPCLLYLGKDAKYVREKMLATGEYCNCYSDDIGDGLFCMWCRGSNVGANGFSLSASKRKSKRTKDFKEIMNKLENLFKNKEKNRGHLCAVLRVPIAERFKHDINYDIGGWRPDDLKKIN